MLLHDPAAAETASGATVLLLPAAISIVSTTVTTPGVDGTCPHCGSRISTTTLICVRDCTDDCSCNYACLSAHVDRNDLTAGDVCTWAPD